MPGSPGLIEYRGQAPNFEKKYYTALNINATAGARTAVSTDLHEGAVLIIDPYGHSKGKGGDVAQPQTSFLGMVPVVLNRTPPDTDAAGEVEVQPHCPGKPVVVRVDGGSVNIAALDPLVMQNGSFDLVKGVGPLTGGQKVYFIALEAATANNTLIKALCVDPAWVVTTAITDSSGGTAAAAIAANVGVSQISFPLNLAAGPMAGTSAADVVTGFVPGFRFKLLALDFVTGVAGTGSGASQTLNLEIGTTNVTAGTLNVTLASTSDVGELTEGAAITGANTGTASDAFSVELAASGTAFTGGSGNLIVTIQNLDTADAFATIVAALKTAGIAT